jgi:hypothetical protein
MGQNKGLAVDDTTFHLCPSLLPATWPNTQTKVTSIRIFTAWKSEWSEDYRQTAWQSIVNFVQANDAKVLVGTELSCNETDDDIGWQNVKELLKLLTPKHVMGVAIGNELELLYAKPKLQNQAGRECIQKMWPASHEGGNDSDGYFMTKFRQRIDDLDNLPGFQDSNIDVTSVFGGAILGSKVGEYFQDNPQARIQPVLTSIVKQYKERFVFTLNIYPYFSPGNALDHGTSDQCTNAIKTCTCFKPGCNFPATADVMRNKMKGFAKSVNVNNSKLWITETGWSYPKADTLTGPMVKCPNFSSEATARSYYENFLDWDLSWGKYSNVDHVFYFTIRDSQNFHVQEGFGIIGGCYENPNATSNPKPNMKCKFQSSTYQSSFPEIAI